MALEPVLVEVAECQRLRSLRSAVGMGVTFLGVGGRQDIARLLAGVGKANRLRVADAVLSLCARLATTRLIADVPVPLARRAHIEVSLACSRNHPIKPNPSSLRAAAAFLNASSN